MIKAQTEPRVVLCGGNQRDRSLLVWWLRNGGADVRQYLASGFLPKLSWAAMGAFAVSAISIFIVIMWAADLLTRVLFNMLMWIFGGKKDG